MYRFYRIFLISQQFKDTLRDTRINLKLHNVFESLQHIYEFEVGTKPTRIYHTSTDRPENAPTATFIRHAFNLLKNETYLKERCRFFKFMKSYSIKYNDDHSKFLNVKFLILKKSDQFVVLFEMHTKLIFYFYKECHLKSDF